MVLAVVLGLESRTGGTNLSNSPQTFDQINPFVIHIVSHTYFYQVSTNRRQCDHAIIGKDFDAVIAAAAAITLAPTMNAFGQLDGSHIIAQALQDGSFDQIAAMLDALELQIDVPELPSGWPYTTHLLAHIHNLQLEDARFLWKRVPPLQKQDPDVIAVFTLLKALWIKDYEGTWQAFRSHAWPQHVEALAVATGDAVRGRILRLLRGAYSSLSPRRAAALLGLSESEATSMAVAAGWAEDPGSGMLSAAAISQHTAMPSHAQHLERLSQYMMDVEAEAEKQTNETDAAQK